MPVSTSCPRLRPLQLLRLNRELQRRLQWSLIQLLRYSIVSTSMNQLLCTTRSLIFNSASCLFLLRTNMRLSFDTHFLLLCCTRRTIPVRASKCPLCFSPGACPSYISPHLRSFPFYVFALACVRLSCIGIVFIRQRIATVNCSSL